MLFSTNLSFYTRAVYNFFSVKSHTLEVLCSLSIGPLTLRLLVFSADNL